HQVTGFIDGVAKRLVSARSRCEIQASLSHQGTEINLISLQWNDNKTILGYAEHGSFYGFNADHAIRQAADVDLAIDNVAGRKQLVCDVRTDISNARRTLSFRFAEEASVFDGPIVDVGSVRGRRANVDVFQDLIAALDLRK